MLLYVIAILLVVYAVPIAILVGMFRLAWKLAKRHLPEWAAMLLLAGMLTGLIAGEVYPRILATRIARASAEDRAGSVAADSILFGTATNASEALASQPGLRFTEGVRTKGEEPAMDTVPLGRIRFEGVREKPEGTSCRQDEVEEWVSATLSEKARRLCVGWRRTDRFDAHYAHFANRFLSYRTGLYGVKERQDGLLRRSDRKPFNVAKNVEVSGGLWWQIVDLWERIAGLGGLGHPGYTSSTFEFIPQAAAADFLYRGAAVAGRSVGADPPGTMPTGRIG